jgi:aspartyl-tRNA(Asn)/glutamyl-tRNA(Gln) amidotransferase subunit C
MKITEADVDYVAGLANLEVAEEAKKDFADQLTAILGFVEQMNRADVTGIAPTPQLTAGSRHALRDDRVVARTGSSEAGRTVKLFKVPKVITER